MPEVQRYQTALEAVLQAMPSQPSIVSTSIVSALEGHYGDHRRTVRTKGSTLWINPRMALYWCFRLEPVARRILYLDAIKEAQTYWEVMAVIDIFRQHCSEIRERTQIPDNSFDRKKSR
jgi:hypothetical protein